MAFQQKLPDIVLTLTIPLRRYDTFMEKLETSSRAHEILMNGRYNRQPNGDHFERTMEILCNIEEAEMLLDLALRLYPDVVQDIGRDIDSAEDRFTALLAFSFAPPA